MLNPLGPAGVRRLLRVAPPLRLPAGRRLHLRGTSDTAHALLQGPVEVTPGAGGAPAVRNPAQLAPLLGGEALRREPYADTAVALTEGTAVRLERAELERLPAPGPQASPIQRQVMGS